MPLPMPLPTPKTKTSESLDLSKPVEKTKIDIKPVKSNLPKEIEKIKRSNVADLNTARQKKTGMSAYQSAVDAQEEKAIRLSRPGSNPLVPLITGIATSLTNMEKILGQLLKVVISQKNSLLGGMR